MNVKKYFITSNLIIFILLFYSQFSIIKLLSMKKLLDASNPSSLNQDMGIMSDGIDLVFF